LITQNIGKSWGFFKQNAEDNQAVRAAIGGFLASRMQQGDFHADRHQATCGWVMTQVAI